jgi:predicted nucleic acid-binding protein
MKTVFADSSFWIALLNPRDNLHATAEAAYKGLGTHRLITTEMVLAEVFNGLADKGLHIRTAVVKLERSLRQRPEITIIPQTSRDFRDAALRYAERSDQQWSITDCASFITMDREGIREALTYDRHFQQAGFEALLRDN